jgi:hypothetical protein
VRRRVRISELRVRAPSLTAEAGRELGTSSARAVAEALVSSADRPVGRLRLRVEARRGATTSELTRLVRKAARSGVGHRRRS